MNSQPPEAKRVPVTRAHQGDTVTDCYSWLADRNDPDTLAYLKAENDYAEAATAGLGPLRDQIFAEIKARTQESDLSVPVHRVLLALDRPGVGPPAALAHRDGRGQA